MNIGIAGAGLVGRLLAVKLSQQNHQITLFDQDTRTGNNSCAMTAAGMLSPYSELESAEPEVFQLGMRSLQLWPEIATQLQQPDLLKNNGGLLLAHPNDATELVRFKGVLTKKKQALKQYNLQIEIANQTRLQQLEPELAPRFQQGIYFANEAHISAPAFLAATEKYLLQQGTKWHIETTVTNILPNEIAHTNGKEKFDWVFDCRGLGAKQVFPDLRGVRGEVIWLHAPDVHLSRPVRLFHPRYPIYIVPHQNNNYVVGASMIESEDRSPISVQTTLELLSAAYTVHKGFAEARISKILVNCRPAFPDNLPRITHEKGLIRINGLFRHGYLLAPALIEKVLKSMH